MPWTFGGLFFALRNALTRLSCLVLHGDFKKVDADEKIEALKSVAVSRDFRTGHPELVKRFLTLADSYKRMFPTRDLIVTCVYRSPDEQGRLFKQGRFGNPGNIVTNCDGRTKKSQHNYFPSRALDVAVSDGGKIVWDEAHYYPLGVLAKECGLEWGGWWDGFKDIPHFQLPKSVA